MKQEKHDENVRVIVENDLCISCGACTHACPKNNLMMVYNEIRCKWEVEIRETDKCLNCNSLKYCLYVCPSYKIDYKNLAASNENNLLGNIVNVYNGFSLNKETRFNSSSGGVIREITKTLLATNIIHGVIALKHERGLEYKPSVITKEEEMTNSIYHNINFSNAFKLLRNNDGRYLLIGLPCQITSITKLMEIKKFTHLKERVYAKLALICGYSFDRINALAFAHLNGIKLNRITYREKGRYRKTHIYGDREEKIFEVKSPKSFHEDLLNRMFFDKYLVQRGCLYCVDHIGYCADIVLGDAWQKRYKSDVVGTNIIICRTAKGEKIISNMSNCMIENGCNDEIIEGQSECYALGSLGESMKDKKFNKMYFTPDHCRTDDRPQNDLPRLSFRNALKIGLIKKLMLRKHFKLAKYVYSILEFDFMIKYLFKKLTWK